MSTLAPPAAVRRALPLLTALLLLLCMTALTPAQAAPTSIVYVGQLLTSTAPPTAANGTYDFQFQLFNAATGGTQVGPTVSLASVPVVNGVYQVQLSFGNVFTGQTLWLQISDRVHPSSGSPAYTTLTPRMVAPNSAFADYATLSGSTQGLQTKAVSSVYPTSGQVLTYNGTLWAPASLGASNIAVPLSLSGSSSSPIVRGSNSGAGTGVYGVNTVNGDYGFLGGTDPIYGAAVGVFGSDTSSAGTNGIFGLSVNGSGTAGVSTNGVGVYGSSTNSDGMQGQSAEGSHSGVAGVSNASYGGMGVFGVSRSTGDYGFLAGLAQDYNNDYYPAGVYGYDDSSGGGEGVKGYSLSGDGVEGNSDSGEAVVGQTKTGFAGHFYGDVVVDGTLYAGTKDFRIDHPLDPAGKYLYHASVESDEMKDVYDGVVTTDAQGIAQVTLPTWFGSLNGDFRYQLTCIGQFAQAIVATEIQNNRFTIKTDKPSVKVSWQVTGVRHDAYALAHPLQVEQDKPQKEQGTYQNPDAFGLPAEAGLGYARRQAHKAQASR